MDKKRRKSKQWTPEDFLTRAERLKLLKIPESSDNLIIVKPNNEALGFRFNCYHESLLGSIEKSKFDSTVHTAHKICEEVWRMKKKEENAEYNKGLKVILYIAVMFTFAAFIMLIDDIYGGGNSEEVYAATVLLVISALMALFVVVFSLFSHPKFIVLETRIIERLNSYFSKENEGFYKTKGYKWNVQEQFYWLELKKTDGSSTKLDRREIEIRD